VNTLAVITNRGSTRNLRGDNWIDPLLEGEANLVHFKLDRIEQMSEIVQRCADAGADVIIVNGGDGTADLVFAALLNGKAYTSLPALALLPAGKTNMTAADWSLTGKPEEALARVLQSRRAGTLASYIVNRPVLTLERGAGVPSLYGAFFGAGEVVEGIHFCRRRIYPLKMPNTLSHMAALFVLLWRGLSVSTKRGSVAVQTRGQVLESGSFFAVGVTALNELLLGIRVAPENGGSDAPLNYLSIRLGPRPMLGVFADVLRRRFGRGTGRSAQRIDQVTLRFDGAYTLDGELYEARAEQPLTLHGTARLNFLRIPA